MKVNLFHTEIMTGSLQSLHDATLKFISLNIHVKAWFTKVLH